MSFSAVIGAYSLALAQPFPSKPLRILVPFPPSGSVELRKEDLPDGPAARQGIKCETM
jgi:hypothetical protein